jgi:hypothetical protein
MTPTEERKQKFAEEFYELLDQEGYEASYGKVDWPKFFAWLREFLITVGPMIVPLFSGPIEADNENK